MAIIDTHVHAWNVDQVEYAWLKGNKSILNRTWSLDELEPELEPTGIQFGVMVQAANSLEDTHFMLEECAKREWLKGAVGWLPLMEPGMTSVELTHFLINPYFKGIRHLIHDEANPEWLLQPSVIESFRVLEKNQISFDVVANQPVHLDCVLKLSDKYPHMRWCIDHLANPPIVQKERWGKWGERMKSLSANPNVFIKISGLGMNTSDLNTWSANEIQPTIEYCLELFGTERAMMGGDWPVVELCGGYSKSWMAYNEILSRNLSSNELEFIHFRNANRFYKLGL